MRLVKREVVQIGNLSDLLLRFFAHKHLLREARKLANGTIVKSRAMWECGVHIRYGYDFLHCDFRLPEGIRLCLGHIFQ